MNFGGHLDPLELDFEQFLEQFQFQNLVRSVFVTFVLHCIYRVPNAFNFHIAGFGILDQRVDYFLFALQVCALSVTVNSFYM